MATQSSDSDEREIQSDRKLARLRTYRRGNRAVVTKLQAEVTALIQNSYTDPDVLSKLQSNTNLLKSKHEYLRQVDEEILELCIIEQAEKEIEECSDWESRIIETLGKIEQFKQFEHIKKSFRQQTTNNQRTYGSATSIARTFKWKNVTATVYFRQHHGSCSRTRVFRDACRALWKSVDSYNHG